MKKQARRLSLIASLVAAGMWMGSFSAAQAQNLPVETLTGGHSITVGDPQDRIFAMDAVFFHLTDSRVNVFDSKSGKFLGMIPTAFNAHAQMSKDGQKIYVATTYFERITRGDRADVIEIWNGDDLSFEKEIIIPPKRGGALNYDTLFTQTKDGRFLLLQNASPATSVAVIDMEKEEFATEITATAGCWSMIPLPTHEHAFASICGDGSLLQVYLDDDGKLKDQQRTKPFFPVEDDPIFISPGVLKDKMVFISFYGNVYTGNYTDKGVEFEDTTWSLLDDKDKEKNWVPGGYNLMNVDPETNRMYVLMHPDGVEGSHKNPAAEIWVYDLNKKERVARIPGKDALSIALTHGSPTQLLTTDAENINIYDITEAEPKEISTIEGASETALQLFAMPKLGGK